MVNQSVSRAIVAMLNKFKLDFELEKIQSLVSKVKSLPDTKLREDMLDQAEARLNQAEANLSKLYQQDTKLVSVNYTS